MQRPQPKRANQTAKLEVSPEVGPNEAEIKKQHLSQSAVYQEVKLVPRTGLEPVTVGLEIRCSIQLSYRGSGRTGNMKDER